MPATPAPVIVFCYNRPVHLRQTLDALAANALAKESDLFIFADGARSEEDKQQIEEVRKVIDEIKGFRSVTPCFSETNRGLAHSVIAGVTEILSRHPRVIVLEDDMLCTSDFLQFMNEALEMYAERKEIFSVTGYRPPFHLPEHYKADVFLSPRTSSWGWATWNDRWAKADWAVNDFDLLKQNRTLRTKLTQGGADLWPMMVKQHAGVISSWSVRWTWTQVKNSGFSIYPVRSKIRNIGTDGSGTNFTFKSNAYGEELDEKPLHPASDVIPDPVVITRFREFYRVPFLLRVKNLVKYGIILY